MKAERVFFGTIELTCQVILFMSLENKRKESNKESHMMRLTEIKRKIRCISMSE